MLWLCPQTPTAPHTPCKQAGQDLSVSQPQQFHISPESWLRFPCTSSASGASSARQRFAVAHWGQSSACIRPQLRAGTEHRHCKRALSKTAVQLCEHLPHYPWYRDTDWQQRFWLLVNTTSPTAAGAQPYRHCSNTGPRSRKHLQRSQYSTPCLPNAPSGNSLAAAQLVCFTRAQAMQCIIWQQRSQAQPPAGLLTLLRCFLKNMGLAAHHTAQLPIQRLTKQVFFIALIL